MFRGGKAEISQKDNLQRWNMIMWAQKSTLQALIK